MRTIVTTALIATLMGAGCPLNDPGGAVRRGLGQSKVYEWGETGKFRVEGNGPQTERFTMAEGHIVMTLDEDGNDVPDWEKSYIQYYLRADPKADDAANAMTAALQASIEQSKNATAIITGLIQALPGLIGAVRPPPAAATPDGGDTASLRDMLRGMLEDELRNRFGGVE